MTHCLILKTMQVKTRQYLAVLLNTLALKNAPREYTATVRHERYETYGSS